MFWISLLLLSYPSCVRLHTTSCTEDTMCERGFFCMESLHSCLECIHCEDFKREPATSSDACVKSVLECGKCLKGLTQVYDDVKSAQQCVPFSMETPTAILPIYAWVGIALSLVLMIIILCLFAKMKNFKIFYATSVQSLHTLRMQDAVAPPPAYHNIDVVSPSSPCHHSEAFEMQKLVESPHPCGTLPLPDMRSRENSNSQNARVFNNPAYVRAPQHDNRPPSPNLSAVVRDEVESDVNVATTSGDTPATTTTTCIVSNSGENNQLTNSFRNGDKIYTSSLQRKTNIRQQDSNNNYSAEDETRRGNGNAARCTNVLAGPSFVINVVENINNSTLSHVEFNT